MSTNVTTPALDTGYTLAQAELTSLFLGAVLYGIFTVIYIINVHLHIYARRGRRMPSRSRILLSISTIQYALSTSYIVLCFTQDIQTTDAVSAGDTNLNAIYDQPSLPAVVAELAFEIGNILIADSILMWRAWLIWSRSRWAVAPAAVMILGTLVTSMVLLRQCAIATSSTSVFTAPGVVAVGSAFALLTLVTNLYLTSMIIGRVLWQARRISRALGYSVGGGTYQSVVILVAESGAVYSLTWLVALVFFILGGNVFYVLFDMLAQMTGLIPTLILLLVTLRLTHGDAADAYADRNSADHATVTAPAVSISAMYTTRATRATAATRGSALATSRWTTDTGLSTESGRSTTLNEADGNTYPMKSFVVDIGRQTKAEPSAMTSDLSLDDRSAREDKCESSLEASRKV